MYNYLPVFYAHMHTRPLPQDKLFIRYAPTHYWGLAYTLAPYLDDVYGTRVCVYVRVCPNYACVQGLPFFRCNERAQHEGLY